jgi:trehalose 6-phosphate synthase
VAGQPPSAGSAVPDCATGPLPLLEDLDDTGPLGGVLRPDSSEHAEPPAPGAPAAGIFDLVVVANRLPVDRREGPDGTSSWQPSPGGLVAALEPVMRRQGGAWVGWTGSAGDAPAEFDSNGMHLVPIGMDADEVNRFYEGMSNGTLWPLYHDVIVPPTFHRAWWESYVRINRRFADAAAAQASPGGTVWVQDYQLQLVPRMLRRMRPDLRIGFFNHIPFPPYEIFSQLPWRRQVLKGLLGADLLGFQRPADANNFLRACRRIGLPSAGGRVQVDGPPRQGRAQVTSAGRTVRAAAFPISIDAQMFDELAHRPEVQERARQIRQELGSPELVLLGVDRLDYTKGILHRLQAFGELLDEGRLTVPGAVLVQVATPSRERVGQYQHMREQVEVTVGRINGTHGQIGHPAVHYLHQSVNREELVALYLAADVMLVTSLRDGMNLVAKEYVATRMDERGSLVLSEFTGAAIELKQAYVVNPHDIDGLKAAVVVAASAGPREASRRMRQLRRRVFEFDVARWAADFLRALERSRDSGLDELAGQPDLLDIARLEASRGEPGGRHDAGLVDLGPDDPDLASLEEDDLAPVDAELDRAELDGAELDGAELVRAELVRAELDRAELDGEELDGVRFDTADFNAIPFDGTPFEGVQFGRRKFDRQSFEPAGFEPAGFGDDRPDSERLDHDLATLLRSPQFPDLDQEELERLHRADLNPARRSRGTDQPDRSGHGLTSGRHS